jgi:hypothetical protein
MYDPGIIQDQFPGISIPSYFTPPKHLVTIILYQKFCENLKLCEQLQGICVANLKNSDLFVHLIDKECVNQVAGIVLSV